MQHAVMEYVLELRDRYDHGAYTAKDVLRVLAKDHLTPQDFGILPSPAAEPFLEVMARKAMAETSRHFGNAVQLLTPLYLSNHCDNLCVYCGFNCRNEIRRGKLSEIDMEKEMGKISATGLSEILLLTGESRSMSDVDYIGKAVKTAARIFPTVGIEIYPLDTDEYAFLHACGADFVSVYQETYDRERYRQVHLKGKKRDFTYRFDAQERALQGGMRGVAFGALLGLDDFRKDAYAAGIHGHFVQQRHPHVELSFSFPRLRPFVNQGRQTERLQVGETQLFQVMLAYRLFLPFAGLTISTRERSVFRDNVVGLCATKMSAGVKVGVGGHGDEQKGDDQFEISDSRSVAEVHQAIREKGMQPVYADHIRV
ncbi:2-iminoacetate synthase ThiH [Anaerotalea alkaliphila]|uniref:2-iminoacetate synthase ThiH n=1 Tax=Anaerotalea alkaliphila TaxID=2662126 RepID=A0A7X5HXW2_9FIRM|nr:2-iminoacetate synthase ThiH [Anaerotalea alkaliphila]NDL68635.1 2-iminoacetate synthase ThiH [Anaerotalea alkaliphila]